MKVKKFNLEPNENKGSPSFLGMLKPEKFIPEMEFPFCWLDKKEKVLAVGFFRFNEFKNDPTRWTLTKLYFSGQVNVYFFNTYVQMFEYLQKTGAKYSIAKPLMA